MVSCTVNGHQRKKTILNNCPIDDAGNVNRNVADLRAVAILYKNPKAIFIKSPRKRSKLL